MDYFCYCLGGLLLLVGFVGCVVPVLPGPVCGLLALCALWPTPAALAPASLAAVGAVVALVMVLDYVVPALGAKKFDCSRWGVFGCLVGTLVGVFFFPWGLLLGPFGGAFVGELVAGKTTAAAVKGGFGALLGFLVSVVLKFAAVGLSAFLFTRAVMSALGTSA